ncbi:unnamed protein product, partial [Ixodes pacificus]
MQFHFAAKKSRNFFGGRAVLLHLPPTVVGGDKSWASSVLAERSQMPQGVATGAPSREIDCRVCDDGERGSPFQTLSEHLNSFRAPRVAAVPPQPERHWASSYCRTLYQTTYKKRPAPSPPPP